MTVLSLTKEQETIRAAVIKYVKEAYRLSVNTRVPSLRGEICKHVKDRLGVPCYPDKLQPCFPPELDGPGALMKRICKASAVPYPRERIRLAKKAIKGKSRKVKERAKEKGERREVTGQAATSEIPEGPEERGPVKDLRRSYEIVKQQEAYKRQAAEEIAKQVYILAMDPIEEISTPVINALAKILPRILKRKFGVAHNLSTILNAHQKLNALEEAGLDVEEALRLLPEWGRLSGQERSTFKELTTEAQKTGRTVLQTLQAQHKKIRRERKKLQTEREALLKAREEDPEKKALKARVCELEETIEGLEGSLNLSLTKLKYMSETIRACDRCSKRFLYLALNDERFASQLSKDPMIKLLLSLS